MPPECVKHLGPIPNSSLFRMFTWNFPPKYATQQQRPSLKCESSDFPDTYNTRVFDVAKACVLEELFFIWELYLEYTPQVLLVLSRSIKSNTPKEKCTLTMMETSLFGPESRAGSKKKTPLLPPETSARVWDCMSTTTNKCLSWH